MNVRERSNWRRKFLRLWSLLKQTSRWCLQQERFIKNTYRLSRVVSWTHLQSLRYLLYSHCDAFQSKCDVFASSLDSLWRKEGEWRRKCGTREERWKREMFSDSSSCGSYLTWSMRHVDEDREVNWSDFISAVENARVTSVSNTCRHRARTLIAQEPHQREEGRDCVGRR